MPSTENSQLPRWFRAGRIASERVCERLWPSPRTGVVLYHYTDVGGLVSIVNSQELWMSDAAFLNDRREIEYVKLLIGQASEAHAEFAILQELWEMPAARDEWMDGIRELKDMIHEHVRMEDETMFPAARAELAETRAEELGRRIEERQKEV